VGGGFLLFFLFGFLWVCGGWGAWGLFLGGVCFWGGVGCWGVGFFFGFFFLGFFFLGWDSEECVFFPLSTDAIDAVRFPFNIEDNNSFPSHSFFYVVPLNFPLLRIPPS